MRVFIGRAAGLALVLAMCVVGCGGDDSEAIHEVDASRPDAPLPVDAGAHVSVDAGESTVKGGAGRIEITPNGVVAGFSPEFTPLHFAEAPHCVVHVKPIGASGETVFRAGTLRLAGPVVGTPGAMPAPVVVPIVSRDYYLYTAGPVVGATDAYLVEVSLSGNSRLPPMAVQSLRPAAAEPITLLEPAAFGGVITARATEDFEVAWTVPTGPTPSTASS